jgi:hypothetical protein
MDLTPAQTLALLTVAAIITAAMAVARWFDRQ